MSSGEFLLYQPHNGQARIQLRVQDGTVWLSQTQLEVLRQVSVPAIAQRICTIFEEVELNPSATINDCLIVADGRTRWDLEAAIAEPAKRFERARAAPARAAKMKKGRAK